MCRKIKVLHIVDGLGFGGAETWLLQVVKQNQGLHQFDFLLTGGIACELDAEFASLGCKLHYLKFSGKRLIPFIKSFNSIVRQERYEVIHDHQDFVAGWHWLFLLFRLPGKRISHAHSGMIFINNYRKTAGRKFFYTTGKLLNALLATHITGTSDQLMEELGYNKPPYKRKKIEPLYCGSDPLAFKYDETKRNKVRTGFGLAPSDKLIVFIGRIGLTRLGEMNTKNPELAFEIAKRLAKDCPVVKTFFIGVKGKLGEQLEEEVVSLNLQTNIRFLGNRNDVHEILQAADLMLVTAILEGFGLVLVEAQFSSLSIIASDVVTKEVVIFPELLNWLNVRSAHLDEWTNTIKSFLKSGFLRQDFSADHVLAIEQSVFSIDASYRRLLKYYY